MQSPFAPLSLLPQCQTLQGGSPKAVTQVIEGHSLEPKAYEEATSRHTLRLPAWR